MANEEFVERSYSMAREQYGALGVDVDAALARLDSIGLSLHCWQGDDIGGFESREEALGGGLAVTGRYPGKARNAEELRQDLEVAMSLIPGRHRVNLHALYAETKEQRVERNELQPSHFRGWIEWARERGLGLDFNPTFFAHPLAADGFTLAHADAGIRRFWIEHGVACRRIAAAMGAAVGTPCVSNVWIPDGFKDSPVDRKAPRERLVESLDAVFEETLERRQVLDSVESKLFGIGSESYVVGSHEFYLGYAITRDKLLCLDAGHFHPTESIGDKLTAVLLWLDEVLLHVSRGVRWDSDHVVTWNDDVRFIAEEIVRGGFLARVHVGLDFFDASINRVAAWVIGARSFLKGLLAALLEPIDSLRQAEDEGDYTRRLFLLEELKSLPIGAVWDGYCLRCGVPESGAWFDGIKRYERDVLSLRG